MKRACIFLVCALGMSSLAFADIVLSFSSAPGDLGVTHTYALGTASIGATGYNPGGSGSSNHLYGKTGGGDENGLGLVGDPTGDNEIWYKTSTLANKDFIQLDILDLIVKGYTNIQFEMGSTTGGESWQVAGCSVSGTLCTSSAVTGSGELSFISAPSNLSLVNHFMDFTSIANSGGKNVLLVALSAAEPGGGSGNSVPEPSQFLGLLMAGVPVVILSWRKRRAAQTV